MKKIALVALVLAAACSKKAPSQCEASIGKGLDGFADTVKNRTNNVEMKKQMTTVIGKLKTTLVQRCTEDKWAPEVTTCFETVVNMRAMQACQSKLTPEQHTKVSAAIREVMMNGDRMPAGEAGHPTTLHGNEPGAAAAGEPAAAPAGAADPNAKPAGEPAAAPAGNPAAKPAAGDPAKPAAGGW